MALAVLTFVALLNLVGVKITGKAQDVFTIVKIALLLCFIGGVMVSPEFSLGKFNPGLYVEAMGVKSATEVLQKAVTNSSMGLCRHR